MLRTCLVVLLLAGCVEGDPPVPPIDDSPRIRSAMEVLTSVLHDSPADLAVGLSEHRVALAGEAGLHRVGPLQDGAELLAESLTQVTGLAELEDDLLVVADASGLYTLGSNGPQPSPLSDLLADESIGALLSAPGPSARDLWLAGGQDLHRWREGQLVSVRPEGAPLGGARLAWGSAVDGVPALWVGTTDSLLALVDADGGLEARVEDGELAPSSLGVDGYGTVWVATLGELWSRTTDGERKQVALPVEVWGVAANSGSAELWLETDEGLWHHRSGVFRPVVDGPQGGLLGVDGAGRALVTTGEQVLQIAADRTVLFVGLKDGAALEAAVDVHVVPSWKEGVEDLRVFRDGEEVQPKAHDPFRVRLDPMLLEDGAHELSATVRYDDGEVESSLFFSVGKFVPPTWEGDVEPLFRGHCALCHTAEQGSVTVGGGHPLDTLLAWQTEVALILEVVNEGRMPLNNPSLSDDAIRTIENWRAGGFLE